MFWGCGRKPMWRTCKSLLREYRGSGRVLGVLKLQSSPRSSACEVKYVWCHDLQPDPYIHIMVTSCSAHYPQLLMQTVWNDRQPQVWRECRRFQHANLSFNANLSGSHIVVLLHPSPSISLTLSRSTPRLLGRAGAIWFYLPGVIHVCSKHDCRSAALSWQPQAPGVPNRPPFPLPSLSLTNRWIQHTPRVQKWAFIPFHQLQINARQIIPTTSFIYQCRKVERCERTSECNECEGCVFTPWTILSRASVC